MKLKEPIVTAFLHDQSSTITYLVVDKATKSAAVIDPVADYDISTGKMSHNFSDKILTALNSSNYNLDWIIETHVHADHVSDAQYFKKEFGGKIAIGSRIKEVQKAFVKIYDEEEVFPCDGSQFDYLINPGEIFQIGELEATAISTPGHTPACMSYLIGTSVFVGDSIFMPDFGTARCDFPGGSAKDLYTSAKKLVALPDETRVFVGHDYGPGGRAIAWETTIGAEKQSNIHIRDGISLDDFVKLRETRDSQLNLPGMIIPSIQINMRAGKLPYPSENGVSYLKTPINNFPGLK